MEASDIVKITYELIRIHGDRLHMNWEDDRGRLLREIDYLNNALLLAQKVEKKSTAVSNELQAQITDLLEKCLQPQSRAGVSRNTVKNKSALLNSSGVLQNNRTSRSVAAPRDVTSNEQRQEVEEAVHTTLLKSPVVKDHSKRICQQQQHNKENEVAAVSPVVSGVVAVAPIEPREGKLEHPSHESMPCKARAPTAVANAAIATESSARTKKRKVPGEGGDASTVRAQGATSPLAPLPAPATAPAAAASTASATVVSTSTERDHGNVSMNDMECELRVDGSPKKPYLDEPLANNDVIETSTTYHSSSNRIGKHTLAVPLLQKASRRATIPAGPLLPSKSAAPEPTSRPVSRPAAKCVEVVRDRKLRAVLPGHTCEQCAAYYDELRRQGLVTEDTMAGLLEKCSRHKSRWSPPHTPDGFWDLSVHTPDNWKT